MTTWFNSITIDVDVGFDTDPYEAFASPTDVSGDVRRLRVSHGRTSLDSGLAVSTANLMLGSRSRQYDPDYAAGAHFGDLVKGKRVAVSVGGALAAATLFTGFAQRWNHHLYFQKDAVAEVPCVGGSGSLDSSPLPDSAYSQEVIDDGANWYWPVQDGVLDARVGSDGPLLSADRLGGPIEFATRESAAPLGEENVTYGQQFDALDRPVTLADLPDTLEAWVDLTGTGTGEVRIRAQLGSTTWMSLQIVNDGSFGFGYSHASDNLRWFGAGMGEDTSHTPGLTTGPNHVALKRNGSNLEVFVNGTLWMTAALSAGTDTLSVPLNDFGFRVYWPTGSGETPGVSHVAAYNTAPSTTQLNAHYNVGKWAWTGAHGIYGFELGGARIGRVLDDCDWPTADRDIDTGGTRMGPYLPAGGNAVDYLHQIEDAEQGVVCMSTDGKVRFVDRQTLWTVAPVCTFSDDGEATAVKYSELELDTGEVYNIVTATWSNGTTGGAVTQRDQTSIDSHTAGSRTIDPGTTLADAQEAANLAGYRLREDKDPHAYPRRLRCSVRLPTQAATVVQGNALCALELGDVVQVEYTPMALGSQTVKRAIVLGLEHDITPDQWEVTLHLAPAPTFAETAPYLILGDADFGKIGVTAGNLLPY
jgi:hypothetical protein